MATEQRMALLPDRWEFTQAPAPGTEIQCPHCNTWSPAEEWDAGMFARDLGCDQWYLLCPICPPGEDRVFGSFDDYEQPVPVRSQQR